MGQGQGTRTAIQGDDHEDGAADDLRGDRAVPRQRLGQGHRADSREEAGRAVWSRGSRRDREPSRRTANGRWHPDINIDVVPGMRYPCKDLLALGGELSSLLKNAESAARKTGYTISRDPFPQRNYFARNDEYAFALQGVPAIMLRNGTDGDEVLAKWTATHYHKPLDNIDQPIDYEAGLKATVTNFLLGYEVAQQDQSPKWNENDFLGAKFGKLPPGK